MTANRVLYLLSAYPVRSQTFVRNEIHALRARGVDVTVLAMNPGDGAAIDPIWAGPHDVMSRPSRREQAGALLWWATRRPLRLLHYLCLFIALGGRGRSTALAVLPAAVRQVALEGDVGAVHTHFGWRAASPCLLAGRLLGARTSVTLHANDIYMPSPRLRQQLGLFDRLVTVCRYNLGVVAAVAAKPVMVDIVPCGVEVPASEPAPVRGARILSVGRIVPKKGFADLVAAVEIVAETVLEVELEIIGDGPDREQLADLVARSPHRDKIHLRGAVAHDEVLRAMDSCSVFALACRLEEDGGGDALPVVIREAMARARPVVSTRLAGIPETLEGVGWLADSGDVPSLADALSAALADDGEPQRRAALARRRVLDQYTLEHTAAGMERVLGLVEYTPEENNACAS